MLKPTLNVNSKVKTNICWGSIFLHDISLGYFILEIFFMFVTELIKPV
jgi:hypothetical protein